MGTSSQNKPTSRTRHRLSLLLRLILVLRMRQSRRVQRLIRMAGGHNGTSRVECITTTTQILQPRQRAGKYPLKLAPQNVAQRLRTFLGQVSDPFCKWLTGDTRTFSRYDTNADGAIDGAELECACLDFLIAHCDDDDDGLTL